MISNYVIGILEPDKFSRQAITLLESVGVVDLFDEQKEKMQEFLHNKQALFIRLKYQMSEEIFQYAPTLCYLCSPTTGLNHIDLEASRRKGIEVLSLRGEETFLSTIRATPEHIFGLTIALLRNYKDAFLSPTNRAWDRDKFRGHELYQNRIGIIGFGRIGKILAKYFDAFGAHVFFFDCDPEIRACHHAQKLNSIDEVIEHSTIVVLCTSYEPNQAKFFGKVYLDLLENKYFINASRGECVDEEYLLHKIEENYFKGIALDVITDETRSTNNLDRLLKLSDRNNLVVTPHIGGATYESMSRTEEFIAKKLITIIENEHHYGVNTNV